MKISWGSHRELKKFDYDIETYYKKLVEDWNKFEEYIYYTDDKRTNYNKFYNSFFYNLLYMWDMIKQTNEKIKLLENKINEQQKIIDNQNLELQKYAKFKNNSSKKINKEMCNKVNKLLAQGISYRNIAKELRISTKTIKKIKDGQY